MKRGGRPYGRQRGKEKYIDNTSLRKDASGWTRSQSSSRDQDPLRATFHWVVCMGHEVTTRSLDAGCKRLTKMAGHVKPSLKPQTYEQHHPLWIALRHCCLSCKCKSSSTLTIFPWWFCHRRVNTSGLLYKFKALRHRNRRYYTCSLRSNGKGKHLRECSIIYYLRKETKSVSPALAASRSDTEESLPVSQWSASIERGTNYTVVHFASRAKIRHIKKE